jgi:hypothetical protein
MELDLQSLFGLHVHSCIHWLRPPRNPLPSSCIWAHIRGRYWSAKIDPLGYSKGESSCIGVPTTMTQTRAPPRRDISNRRGTDNYRDASKSREVNKARTSTACSTRSNSLMQQKGRQKYPESQDARTNNNCFCTVFVNWCDSELGVHYSSSPFILIVCSAKRLPRLPGRNSTRGPITAGRSANQ